MKASRQSVKKSAPAPTKGHSNTHPLRIIGGRWRGRKLNFPAVDGLRPTGDRIRETLFNWLAPRLPDARCLDLFAGSGALGLEALSRGASLASLLEQHPGAAQQLREHLHTLACPEGQVIHANSLDWLDSAPPTPFDIVFIDPPFRQNLWQESIDRLNQRGWLAPDAAIYIESEPETALTLPPHWQLHRNKTSGQVRYRLYFVNH
ncbi:16S rRNA (guanine(966)-N(2))-methyltransferase RsmD [Marinimicrobium sp. ARAG 43.8]|uniref:16S rRNA (guanine(966)-N(2))-methyltransferase RsmD n=1 Tax=Marinimicrobium sp. ARAG 43.8 TaxID=3418719 RepID=UPI003CEE89FC